jgi:hypothetical protein
MEFWKECWNCGHETLQKRVNLDFFPRSVELFSKHSSGKVKQRVWAVFFDAYSFMKCKKCYAPSLLVDEYWTQTDSVEEAKRIKEEIEENGISKSGNLIKTLSYPGFSKEPFPQWTHDLEETYMILFWEVYQAISLGLNAIAMMGLRAIIDKYANDKVGDINGFAKKLVVLKEKSFINQQQYDLLEVVVDAGNASSHRGFRPSKAHLKACLQIVEHLLEIEQFGELIEQVKIATPKRKKGT